jgi:hypothetical protein
MADVYENLDLFEIRRKAGELRANYLRAMMIDFKAWLKSNFTFGVVTHA